MDEVIAKNASELRQASKRGTPIMISDKIEVIYRDIYAKNTTANGGTASLVSINPGDDLNLNPFAALIQASGNNFQGVG